MAEGKSSFVLYSNYDKIFEELTDEEAGKLIKIIFQYVNDKNPVIDDRLLKIAFAPIKANLKRDLQNWGKEIDKKKEGAALGNLKRWHKPLYEQVINGTLKLEDAINQSLSITVDRIPSHSDKIIAPVAVNVNVNDNDNVNVNDIKSEPLRILEDETITDLETGKAIEFIKFTTGRLLTKKEISNLWSAYLIHSTGTIHKDRNDKLQHFRNWLKFQEPHKKVLEVTPQSNIKDINQVLNKYA